VWLASGHAFTISKPDSPTLGGVGPVQPTPSVAEPRPTDDGRGFLCAVAQKKIPPDVPAGISRWCALKGGTEGLGSTETDDPSGGGPSRIDLGCFVLTLLAATPSERAKKKPRPGPGLSEVSNRIRLEGPRRLRCYRELASAGRPMPAATSGYFRAQTGRSVKYRSSDRAWPTPVAPLAH
jgi:hypothetical protein